MKVLLFSISILFLFTSCAIKSKDAAKIAGPVEPSEPQEPKELKEGEMHQMPNVQMPEIPQVKLAVSPGIPTFSDQHNITINRIVDAACGQCQLGITGKAGCDLAVRIDGKSYFVDGTSIHDHGDAHAHDGFCEVIRQAQVKGNIVDGRFQVESFKVIE
tara:strand:+ start:54 stop:530 length:477 start_codon:yes stop_codon:yes gene_type:complete